MLSPFSTGEKQLQKVRDLQEITESSLPSIPTETPHITALPRVPAERVPENQPPANEIPPDRWYQIFRNMKSKPSNSRYDLAAHVTTAIESLSHYEDNAVTNPIIGTSEEYLALLSGPNSKIWTKHSQLTWEGKIR